jgi:uracil-DNA glycosylase family 4
MWRAGFADRQESTGRSDGLTLSGAWVTSAVRCAPPDNRPTPAERDACAPWLSGELDLIRPAVIVTLGGFAYRSVWRHLRQRFADLPTPRPTFAHALEVAVAGGPTVLASYHPSQQNTFTGRLTEEMLDGVFARARVLIEVGR